MRNTGWISSLMDVDRDAEFAGDDVDQFSSIINLKGNYEFVTVILPIMVSSDVTIYIQRTDAVTEVPVIMHTLDGDSADSFAQTSAAVSSAAIALTFRIGGAQYFRLKMDGNQTLDLTFYAKGFNRENM